jgi:hypothetical protein
MACIGCASMRGNRMNRLLMRGGVEKPSSVSYIKPGDYLAYPDSSTVTGMAEQLGALDLTKTEVLVEAIASVPPEVTADVIEKTGQEERPGLWRHRWRRGCLAADEVME